MLYEITHKTDRCILSKYIDSISPCIHLILIMLTSRKDCKLNVINENSGGKVIFKVYQKQCWRKEEGWKPDHHIAKYRYMLAS